MPREPRRESGALVLGAPAAREPAPHLRNGPFQRRFRPPERARRIRVEPLLDPDGGRHAGLPQRVLGDTAEEPAFGCMRSGGISRLMDIKGRCATNVLPFPSPSLLTLMVPPCISMIAFVMARPMPSPPKARVVTASL